MRAAGNSKARAWAAMGSLLAIAMVALGPGPAASAAQAPAITAKSVLPAAGLREDAKILRDAFETLHPGLYRSLTLAKEDAAFRELDAEFARDRTLADAFRAFTALTAKVRCGHTWPSFYNQSQAVARALLEGPRIPFAFRWIDGRMFVTRAWTEASRLPPGTEILALDGTPARKVLMTLMTFARADGSNDARRVSTIEVTGESRYEAFDVYYPLFFPMRPDSIALTLRRPGARTREEVRLALLPYEVRDELAAEERHDAPEGATPIWSREWLDARTMLLHMPTWATYNSRWDWKADLARTFRELAAQPASTLIVDLRGNEGGTDEVGLLLAQHIVRQTVRDERMEKRVRYRRVPERLLPHLDTWDPSFKDWGNAVTEAADGFYRWIQRGPAELVIEPAGEGFAGDVYVLVGAANSSATFTFADVMKRNRLATLVGQPTGGNQRGINGGGMFFLRLPNSGIEVDLPIFGYFPLFPRPDAGVWPDVLVPRTPAGIAAGTDEEMAAVRAEIERKSRK